MKQRLLILCFALFCGASNLQAQTKVQLSVPDVLASSGQGVICAPVIADSFPNIAALQFSLKWDTLILDYVEARFGNNPLMLGALDTTTSLANGQFGVTYTTSDLSGITLSPGTVILEVCFNAIGENGVSPLTWDGFYPAEFAQEGSITPYPFELIPGSLSFGPNTAINVLPGDTNDDGQVDHRDLLNVGLLEGTTGPARPDVSVAFSQQTTTPWPTTLLNGLNHAKVDANGNGLIGATDLDIVADYYGRAEGTFTQAPDISTTTGPALRLEEEDPINAGEETTVTIFLGDGSDADAVGYNLAFTLEYDPEQIEESSIRVAYDDSFLGDDLLSIDKVSTQTNGRLEIALSRRDQLNTTVPGGKVCTISFIAIDPNDLSGVMLLPLKLVPNAFIRANQSAGDITGGTDTLRVQTALAVSEPAWGANLNIYPNPYTNGPLLIQGDLPAYDEVSLSDVTGRRLFTRAGNVRQLDLTAFPAGIYLLQVTIDGQRVTRRVLKR